MNKINWFSLVGGILTLALVAASLFVPWWRLTAGQDIVVVDTSPVATGFSLLGKTVDCSFDLGCEFVGFA